MVDLSASEWASDINTIASALKLWLRELPEPLLTFSLYNGFIEASSTSSQMMCAIDIDDPLRQKSTTIDYGIFDYTSALTTFLILITLL